MKRDKIKVITNVPLVFVLEDARGRESNSQFTGLEYAFSVTQDGTPALLYLPVEGAEALKRSGAQAGDEVQLVKRMGAGNRPLFTAKVFSDAHLPIDAPPPPAPREARMVAPPAPYSHGAAAAQLAPAAPAAIAEALMQRCYMVAGRALLNAHRALASEGYAYDAPTFEDVRAGGISLFIERTRANGGAR